MECVDEIMEPEECNTEIKKECTSINPLPVDPSPIPAGRAVSQERLRLLVLM